jgi:type IV pilus assembly protein PilC
MPKFLYTAKSYTGETKGGEIEAKDEKTLAQQLRSDGFLVTSVKLMEAGGKHKSSKLYDRFLGHVPLKEKMIFCRNLSVMVASGLTLTKSINNLAYQTKNKRFKKVLLDIFNDMQGGKSLGESMEKYPVVFGELFINMVKVGETSGTLEEVLNIVALQMEKEHELVSKVRGAMMYPAVIVFVMAGIGVVMMTYILPKLLGVFKDMDVQLPPTTQFMIAVSDFMRNHSIVSIGILVFLIIFSQMFFKTSIGKKTLSLILTSMPLIKNIVIKTNCARFARIYSSLLKSGVSAVDALAIVSRTLTNYYYTEALRQSAEKIQKGENLSKIISAYPRIFPILVPQMIEVGEETGRTEAVLLKLAEFYEEEVNQITKNMSSIIEPFLMVIIGGAVGFFAVSMLQPMYSLMDNIK